MADSGIPIAPVYRLSARALRIPLRTVFKHASASRAETATLWVRAQALDASGYGEGCPRPYVSGEDVAGALAFVETHAARIQAEIKDLADLRTFVERERTLLDAHPAAWCAVELALLDLFARRAGVPVETLLESPAAPAECRYSAVLGDGDDAAYARQLQRYRKAGMTDFKLKLSGDITRDRARMQGFADSERVRVDANNLWTDVAAAQRHLTALGRVPWAIEEPLAAGDHGGCARLATALAIPVILDESFLRVAQFEALADEPQLWILNLRVSKLGGLLRSLAVVSGARQRGLRCVIGAQVGETSLLTRAALALVTPLGDSLVAQEGGFGTLLLNEDCCDPPLMFGAGGRMATVPMVQRPGFGLAIAPAYR